MKHVLLFLFLTIIFSCASQNSRDKIFDNNDYEVINEFLSTKSLEYVYFDKFFLNRQYQKEFKGDLKKWQRAYTNADSICKNDRDTTRLKMYCRSAHHWEVYKDLISESELNYIEQKYSNDGSPMEFDLKRIKTDFIRKHSAEYYDSVNYKEYDGVMKQDEFPTIRIWSLFYTKDKRTAIIGYTQPSSPVEGGLIYAVLKKQNNIWWKYITSLGVGNF